VNQASSNDWIVRLGVGVIALDILLVGFGILRFPSSLSASSNGWLGLAGDGVVLLACLAATQWGLIRSFRDHPNEVRTALMITAVAGFIFAAQFLLEYLGSLTSNQDGMLANFTFGVLFLLFFSGGFWEGYRERSIRAGLRLGLWSGIFYSLVWVGLLWISFHVFAGTVQESRFFEIDQTLVDFQNSGMSDLRAFVVQDYLGATFFHPLLGAASGCILGLAGGAFGKSLGTRRGRGQVSSDRK